MSMPSLGYIIVTVLTLIIVTLALLKMRLQNKYDLLHRNVSAFVDQAQYYLSIAEAVEVEYNHLLHKYNEQCRELQDLRAELSHIDWQLCNDPDLFVTIGAPEHEESEDDLMALAHVLKGA